MVIALISVNVVPSWDIEGREFAVSVNIVPSWDIEGRHFASVRRYPNEGQYSPISV